VATENPVRLQMPTEQRMVPLSPTRMIGAATLKVCNNFGHHHLLL
jgi:hypothetical protein